ncbi:hypothetical protein [Lysobacter antibioticus]|uniref:hypothetical protein n=1 Tax=Lysobacter antibioticus TaxID=84531 RepID=UPI000348D959|nr:hypothetical protein [Lysobacter antibioticus]
MPAWLHPWFAEARYNLARGDAWWRGRAVRAATLALATPWLLRLCGEQGAALAAAVPRLIMQLPLPFALIALTLGHAAARARLVALDEHMRLGWWAAAPIEPHRSTWTLVVLAALGAVAAALLAALALRACGGDGAIWRSASLVLSGSVAVGVALGLLSALRHRRHPVRRLREGAREPLFGLRWLDDARLPHISDWQRREALLRWRRGGRAWMIGAVLLAMPGGTGLATGAGVLAIAVALAWFSLVAQACTAAARAAAALLAATPQPPQALARAAWRYPAFAFACAAACASGGAALLSLGWTALPALWGLLALTALPLLPGWRRGRVDARP